jgi:hypothetical protein
LPGYGPDDSANEAIWDWGRDDTTANTCLGTRANVRKKVSAFLRDLRTRTNQVKCRCRIALQAQAGALAITATALNRAPRYGDRTVALL